MTLGNASKNRPTDRNFGTWDALAEDNRAPRERPMSNSPVPDDLGRIFGQNVRGARIKAGLTQAQLAERTGLTQQYVSLVEAGLQNVTLDTMAALARAVGRDVSALLRTARNRITPR